MFRTMHSKTVLYCGYWFKPVELDYLCEMHNKSKSCGGPINHLPYEEPEDNKRPVFVIERNGKKLNFESVTAAANFLSVSVSTLCNNITRGCRSKGRQVGYIE